VVAEENIDPAQLDGFAFASRKLPEYMHHRLVECAACDLVYANPAPEVGALAEAYREAEYDSGEEAKAAASTYARLLPAIVDRLPHLRGALDIGAGDGAFLEELLAAGFTEVEGIEPSTAPILAASATVRSLIRQGLFTPSGYTGRKFGLITCFQTIEHVPDPGEMLRDIHSLLIEGGAVLIVCHNRKALSARVLGEKSPIYDIEHLQLFSRRSMSRLLEGAGFVDIDIKPIVNRYPLKYWARLFPLPGGVKSKVLGALRSSRLGAIVIPLPAGNIAAVGYKQA
jgi:SAM-dependent methyltransferase